MTTAAIVVTIILAGVAHLIVLHRLEVARCQLDAARGAVYQYARWLAEFPEVAIALQNLQQEINGAPLSPHTGPGHNGPWTLSALRDVLRIVREGR